MKKIFIIFCMLFIIFSCNKLQDKKEEPILKGVCDIGNLRSTEYINLSGEWIFIPNQFIDPASDFSKYTRFEDINICWNNYKEKLPSQAFATYAIRLKNFSPEVVYALKIPAISSAFMAYLNGEEFCKVGKIGKSRKTEVFDWDKKLVILPAIYGQEVTLVFHISNFNEKMPITTTPLQIGFYYSLSEKNMREFLNSTITAGIIMVIGILFISLYLFFSKGREAFFFGLICIVFSIRVCAYEEFLLKTLLPVISGSVLFKIGYLTLGLEIILFTLFVSEFYTKRNKKYLYFILSPSLIFIILNIFTPIIVSSTLLIYEQIYLVIMAIYNLAILIGSTTKKNKSTYLVFFGLIVFLLLTLNDILAANGIISVAFVAHLGIFVLLIPMAIIVFSNFKGASEMIDKVSKEIELSNQALYKFVPNQFMKFLNKQHVDITLGDNVLKDMHIAFIHLGVFSDLKAKEDRIKFLQIYNETLADVNPIINKYGGFIDKYLPEGLMAVFDSSSQEIIECMLNIKKFVLQKNYERETKNLERINFACGVHFGKLMLGTIGEKNRMDTTVISDVVNVASRLHFYAIKQNVNIFVSEIVKQNSGLSEKTGIKFRYEGKIQFRGKSDSMPIYEVTTTEALND